MVINFIKFTCKLFWSHCLFWSKKIWPTLGIWHQFDNVGAGNSIPSCN